LGRIGECHQPETHLIPLVLQAASGRRAHIAVYGADYDTPDGTCIRDYVHVSDLCQAHWLALQSLLDGGPSQAYNLGHGQGYSVAEVIAAAQQVSGRTIAVQGGPRRPGDPARLVADARLARQALGWQPRHSDLHTLMATPGSGSKRWPHGPQLHLAYGTTALPSQRPTPRGRTASQRRVNMRRDHAQGH
jgi:UDP-glucose 4-epimerase